MEVLRTWDSEIHGLNFLELAYMSEQAASRYIVCLARSGERDKM